MYCTIHLLEIIRLSDFSSPLFYPSLLGIDPERLYFWRWKGVYTARLYCWWWKGIHSGSAQFILLAKGDGGESDMGTFTRRQLLQSGISIPTSGSQISPVTVYVFSRMFLNRLAYNIQRNNYWMVKDIWRIFL